MAIPLADRMTRAEYLARELTSGVKHEYVNGEAYAMTGGTIDHSGLAVAFATQLSLALAGRPCRVFNSDLRIFVTATGANFYPDVSVVCGKIDLAPDDDHSITNPVVLVEVLSKSTEGDDRGAKASHYRLLPSLQEYVLGSQGERRVEVQRRNERGVWELHFFKVGERVELTSLGVSVGMDELYRDPLAG
jgi:Uma2 family endonuclease